MSDQPDLEVRRARPDEFEAIGELTIAAYRDLARRPSLGRIRGRNSRRGQTRGLHPGAGGRRPAGQLLGAVTYVTDPASGWLEWTEPGEAQFRLLAVTPGGRGCGVGEALVRACINLARWRRTSHRHPHEPLDGEAPIDFTCAWVLTSAGSGRCLIHRGSDPRSRICPPSGSVCPFSPIPGRPRTAPSSPRPPG